VEGVDYSGGAISAADLKAAGKSFAVGYCVHRTSIHTLSAAEYQDHRQGGIAQLGVWERSAKASLRGFNGGAADMAEAIQYLVDQGINPDGKPLYLILNDWDAGDADKPAILDYAKGLASVRGPALAGGYGSYWIIKYMAENGNPIKYYWQTYAWSGGLWHPAAQVQQYRNSAATIGAVAVDFDRAVAADFGQWPDPSPGGPPVPDSTHRGATPVPVTQIECPGWGDRGGARQFDVIMLGSDGKVYHLYYVTGVGWGGPEVLTDAN
jgi:hypothetical protein